MSICQALKEDARLYRRLRYGEQSRARFAWMIWLTSTGLFVLAMHRAAHSFQKLRQA